MTDNGVTSVTASPSLIFQRVRGDDVDDEDDDKRVTPKKSVTCKVLKVKANDTMTPMTAFSPPRRDDMTKRRDIRPRPKQPEQLSLLDAIDQDRDKWIRQRLLKWHVGDTG